MLLAIINLLFIFKDIVENYIPKLFNSNIGIKIKECKNPKFSLILTVLIAILAIVLTSIVGVSAFRYYNIGFYLIWIGIICLIAYAFLYKAETNN